MIEEVNKIIYNMLISGRGVYLPDVGTLFIERQGARKISNDKLLGPRNIVNFTSQEQAPSLINEIVSVAGCEQEQAADIYQRWLMKTRQDNILTIGGIGVLNHKSFAIESAFAAAINPKGVKTLIIRRRSNTWLYIICALCVAIALGIFAYIMWGTPSKYKTATSTQEVATTVTPVVDSATTSTAIDQTAVTATQVQDSNTSSTDATPTQTTNKSNVQHNEYFAYYVVMGVFSSEQNAERAVEQARSKISNAICAIIPFAGEKFMVTVYGSDSQAECTEFARANRDVINDLWVYNKK